MIQTFGKTVFSAAAIQPITQAGVLAQLYGDDNLPQVQLDLIDSIIKACTLWAEDFRCERFITQTWDYYFDGFPDGRDELELPYGPLQSITSISYIDHSGTTQTMSASDYTVDTHSFVPRVYPVYMGIWPIAQDFENSVTVRAIQGYGLTASTVPDTILHALKLMAAHFYQKREPYLEGIQLSRVPMTVQSLLMQNRKSFL